MSDSYDRFLSILGQKAWASLKPELELEPFPLPPESILGQKAWASLKREVRSDLLVTQDVVSWAKRPGPL